MKIKTDAPGIWKEYQKGRDYKEHIKLYSNVRKNEAFYIGDQWAGLNAPDLPKPVLNFLKRVVNVSYATIVSDDIAISFDPHERTGQNMILAKALVRQVERVLENAKIKPKNRDLLRNAAVDGDCCLYLRFNPDLETGQQAKGDIEAEVLENINVYFGNPYSGEVQKQPYIILAMRTMTEEVKDEARANAEKGWNKLDEAAIRAIRPDQDENQGEEDDGDDRLTTKLIKLWKQEGTIWCEVSTEHAVIRRPWDTEQKIFPIAWMSWEKRKSSYHGQSMLTGLIPNQIQVNRLFAMLIRAVEMNAYPRVVYDPTKIQWNSDPGKNIEATQTGMSRISDAFSVIRGADVSNQVMEIINSTINLTRDFMGINDAALGNVKPDNTSAIIATQQATAVPLEIQRLASFQMIEDIVRIMLDIMGAYYDQRDIWLGEGIAAMDAEGNIVPAEEGIDPVTELPFDFSTLGTINYDLNVSIGASSYWSELMQMQTMDSLFQKGLIADAVVYLESVPDKYLPNKDKIIDSLKQQQALAAQQAAMQMPGEAQALPTDTMAATPQALQQIAPTGAL